MLTLLSNSFIFLIPIYIWFITSSQLKKFIFFNLIATSVNVYAFGFNNNPTINIIWISFVLGLFFSYFIFKKIKVFKNLINRRIALDKYLYKIFSQDFKNKLIQIIIIFSLIIMMLLISTGVSEKFDSQSYGYFFKKLYDACGVFFISSFLILFDFCIEKKRFSNINKKRLLFIIFIILLTSIGATSKSTFFAFLSGLLTIFSYLIYKSITLSQGKGKFSRLLIKNLFLCGLLIVFGYFILNYFLDYLGLNSAIQIYSFKVSTERTLAINNLFYLINNQANNWKLFSDIPLTLTPIFSPIDQFFNIKTGGSLGLIASCKGVFECVDNYLYEFLYPLPYWGYFDFNYFGSFMMGFIFNSIYLKLNFLYENSNLKLESNKESLNIYNVLLLSLIFSMTTQLSAGKLLWIFADNIIGFLMIAIICKLPKIKIS